MVGAALRTFTRPLDEGSKRRRLEAGGLAGNLQVSRERG